MVYLPVIILLFNLSIFLDKNSGLLAGLGVFRISRIRYWVTKFLFLQLLTLFICILLHCVPPVLHLLVIEPNSFHPVLLITGLFLAVKTWLAMLATTTLVFLFCILFPKFYQSFLAGLCLIIWLLLLPYSPVVFLLHSSIQVEELSRGRQPIEWTVPHFQWEIKSMIMAVMAATIFVLTVIVFRRKAFFRRLFFYWALVFVPMGLASCSSGNDNDPATNIPPGLSKDSLLLDWIDTVSLVDQQGSTFMLNSLIRDSRDSVIYLDFWNSHCVPCMKAFPEIDALSSHYTRNELRVLFLNTDEDPNRWKRALDFTHTTGHPEHFRVTVPDFGLLATIGLNVYPRYVVVNRGGEVLDFHAPVPNEDYVDELLKRISLGDSVEVDSIFERSDPIPEQ